MEPREVLERLVAVVATLGEVVAAVTVPDRDEQQMDGSPGSFLRVSLKTFISHLQDTLRQSAIYLGHGGVTPSWHRRVTSPDPYTFSFLHLHDVPSLGEAPASLEATSEPTWADVRAAAMAWQEPVDTLVESWSRLAEEATRLCNAWAEEATMRGQQAEPALGLLEHLVAACHRAMAYPRELQRRLGDIELALEETREVSLDFCAALEAVVAEAEQLWDASAHLAKDHLLGTLKNIHFLSLCPCPGRDGSMAAERCQRAIEDIPRLLQERPYHRDGVMVPPLQRLGNILRTIFMSWLQRQLRE